MTVLGAIADIIGSIAGVIAIIIGLRSLVGRRDEEPRDDEQASIAEDLDEKDQQQ